MKVSLGDLDLDRECKRNVRSKIVRERKALRDDCPLLNQVGLLLQMVKGKKIIKLSSNVLDRLRRLLWVPLSTSFHYRFFS